jgi:hypothetical protein
MDVIIHKELILMVILKRCLGRAGDDNPQIHMEIPSEHDEVPVLTLNS